MEHRSFYRLLTLTLTGIITLCQGTAPARASVPTDSIWLSDPFVLADKATETYYMTGTGGKMWKSTDLISWEGPIQVVARAPQPWEGHDYHIWAAEIHPYNGKYYYFGTFTTDDVKTRDGLSRRSTCILVSEHPDGPYVPVSDTPLLPPDLVTLDGTFHIEGGKPYMVYCNEWVQNNNGTVEAVELTADLSATAGDPDILFRASDSPWSRETIDGKTGPNRVTDGPWLFTTSTGKLGMLWTSWIFSTYTQGAAYSSSGNIHGPWIQEKEPVTGPDLGHAMIFTTFDGVQMMSLHTHRDHGNGHYERHPVFIPVSTEDDRLTVSNISDCKKHGCKD